MKLYIREIRLNKGLSISQLSKKSGVSQGYISDLENEIKSNIGIEHL